MFDGEAVRWLTCNACGAEFTNIQRYCGGCGRGVNGGSTWRWYQWLPLLIGALALIVVGKCGESGALDVLFATKPNQGATTMLRSPGAQVTAAALAGLEQALTNDLDAMFANDGLIERWEVSRGGDRVRAFVSDLWYTRTPLQQAHALDIFGREYATLARKRGFRGCPMIFVVDAAGSEVAGTPVTLARPCPPPIEPPA